MTIFYTEIEEKMKVSEGGGNTEEGEDIQLIFLPLEEAKKSLFDDRNPKIQAVILSLIWFFNVKQKCLVE